MRDSPDQILLPPAIRYLCHAFGDQPNLSISFDHSGSGQKYSQRFVSSFYRITYDLLNYLNAIGLSGNLKVQLIEKKSGALLLLLLNPVQPQYDQDSTEMKSIIRKVQSLQGGIVIDHTSQGELAITIDLPDHEITEFGAIDRPFRVLIVDDHPLMRTTLKVMLRSIKSIEVIGEATNGKEAIEWVKTGSVDLVLMDITMPGLNGIEATKYISVKYPQVKVLALSMHEEEPFVSAMMEAGAQGYISKTSGKATLIEAIESVTKGEVYILS